MTSAAPPRSQAGIAALWFFLIIGGYFVLKPLREEVGVRLGEEDLPRLFTATFVAMLLLVPLYGKLVSVLPRRSFVCAVYLACAGGLLAFRGWLGSEDEAVVLRASSAFFVFVSVYNLLVVSIFWSYLSDLWQAEDSRRLFGRIAAGGSLGALLGSASTALLVRTLGNVNLLWVPITGLALGALCVLLLEPPAASSKAPPVGGSLFAGFTSLLHSPYLAGIAAFLAFKTFCATVFYFQQASVVGAAFENDPEGRTQLFATINFCVQGLSLVLQALVSERLVARFGVGLSLLLLPVVYGMGFGALGVAHGLTVLVLFAVARQAIGYGLQTPAMQMLYGVCPREDRYKAKSFIDTVVYRGGDAASAWIFEGVSGRLSHPAIALAVVPIAALWTFVAGRLGRGYAERAIPTDEARVATAE